jgi:glutathione synthase/RimK-type ligase-like ATP-grasp enzyme
MPIAIFSYEEDLHALAVQHELSKRGIESHIIETSLMAPCRGVRWSSAAASGHFVSRTGVTIGPRDFRLTWWRKLGQPLRRPSDVAPEDVDFVMRNWQYALEGVMLSEFNGEWISRPDSQRRAANKVSQLVAARAVGLSVPDTLVSADPVEVREFYSHHCGQIITKALKAPTTRALSTIALAPSHLSHEESIRACPAIYQELIPGTLHLRAHVFGPRVVTTSIYSEHLDWRRDLNVPMQPFKLDDELERKLIGLTSMLGLRMGIMDLKLRPEGEAVWLEVNPQGQFLFAEALSGAPLLREFTDFLEVSYLA